MATSTTNNTTPSSPPPATDHQKIPILAGGGNPSYESAQQTVPEFSRPILSHLLSIHHKSTAQNPPTTTFQDGLPWPSTDKDFLTYMASPSASAMSAARPQDLSYPLSSYYISSSHNTYLSGHQLYGTVRAQAYTNVLLRGCRCLEIDIWDGEDHSDSNSESDDTRPAARPTTQRHGSGTMSKWESLKVKAKETVHKTRSRSRSDAHKLKAHDIPLVQGSGGDPSASPNAEPPSARSPDTDEISTVTSNVDSIKLDRHMTNTITHKAEPMVLHGHTLTQGIPFRTVCKAIAEAAFVTTDLPLIVSLEVHASLAQQETMVEIMKELWNKHLVDISGRDEAEINVLPSPADLRNKILIKVKWSANPQSEESTDPLEHVMSNVSVDENHRGEASEKKKKAKKILSQLSELGVYTRAFSFKTFKSPEATIPTHVFSLSESKMHDMHARPDDGPALFNHNRHYLLRVFPKGTRINSSNIDPTFHWRQGAQMVALNWQKLDRGMMINEGMFSGGEGWVLKPEGYRGTHGRQLDDGVHQSSFLTPKPKKISLDLDIQLFAAQHISPADGKDPSHASKVKPYIKLQLHVDTHGPPGHGNVGRGRSNSNTHDADESEEEERFKKQSQTARSDTPDFGGEIISWTKVTEMVEELSFLRLQVKDDKPLAKDDLLAWACVRMDRLQTGIRFIHLLDAAGRPSAGVILVKISKRLS